MFLKQLLKGIAKSIEKGLRISALSPQLNAQAKDEINFSKLNMSNASQVIPPKVNEICRIRKLELSFWKASFENL